MQPSGCSYAQSRRAYSRSRLNGPIASLHEINFGRTNAERAPHGRPSHQSAVCDRAIPARLSACPVVRLHGPAPPSSSGAGSGWQSPSRLASGLCSSRPSPCFDETVCHGSADMTSAEMEYLPCNICTPLFCTLVLHSVLSRRSRHRQTPAPVQVGTKGRLRGRKQETTSIEGADSKAPTSLHNGQGLS